MTIIRKQAFFEYLKARDELSVVSDLAKAQKLVDIYSQLEPPQYYEVVEVSEGPNEPISKGEFLGFDLSCALHFSLLSWGLNLCREPSTELPENDMLQVINPLICLVERYFKPQLNGNLLFNRYDTANFCLECMMTLQRIRPNLWESDTAKFEIVGLWGVYPT